MYPAVKLWGYIQAITCLQALNSDLVRTQRIFKAVLEQDLHFEALVEFNQDRGELLLMKLAHGGLVGDAALDLCNEQSS